MCASSGPPTASDSLSPTKNSFPKPSFPNISSTATTLPSSDRYSFHITQLNMYNFHKIRENNSESYFHHECFDRDNKYLFSYFSQKRHVRNQEKTLKKEKKKLRFWRLKRLKRVNPHQKQKGSLWHWPQKPWSQNPLRRQSLDQSTQRGKLGTNQVRKIHKRTLVFWDLLLPWAR